MNATTTVEKEVVTAPVKAKTPRTPKADKAVKATPPAAPDTPPPATDAPDAAPGPMGAMAASLTQTQAPVVDAKAAKKAADKAKREAERALRYPIAHAKELEAKAAAESDKTEAAPDKTDAVPDKADAASTPNVPEGKTGPVTSKKEVIAFVPRTAQAGQAIHLLDERSRPQSGSRLFAHTHAVLILLGLLDPTRPAVPLACLLQTLGQRAVTYHRKQMNLEEGPKGVCLSSAGRNHFVSRMLEGKIDGRMANAFLAMMLDGQIDSAVTGVNQSNVYQTKF